MARVSQGWKVSKEKETSTSLPAADPCSEHLLVGSYELWSAENTHVIHKVIFLLQIIQQNSRPEGLSRSSTLTDSSVLGGRGRDPPSPDTLSPNTDSGVKLSFSYLARNETKLIYTPRKPIEISHSTPIYCVVTGNHKGAPLLLGWVPFFPRIFTAQEGEKSSGGDLHHGIPTKVILRTKPRLKSCTKRSQMTENSPSQQRGKHPQHALLYTNLKFRTVTSKPMVL